MCQICIHTKTRPLSHIHSKSLKQMQMTLSSVPALLVSKRLYRKCTGAAQTELPWLLPTRAFVLQQFGKACARRQHAPTVTS